MTYFLRRPCSIQECPQWAVGVMGICSSCGMAFCKVHRVGLQHWCSVLMKDEDGPNVIAKQWGARETSLSKLFYSTVSQQLGTFAEQATLLRQGQSCQLAAAKEDWKGDGAINLHVPLLFDDGVKWVVRVRYLKEGDAPSQELQEMVTKSEVATQKLLRQQGVLGVPDAWLPLSYGDDQTEEADQQRLDCFFVEFVEGSAHSRYDFKPQLVTDAVLSAEVAKLFFDDLARHYISLADVSHGLKGIGSIYPTADGGLTLGPMQGAGPVGRPTRPYYWGPFKTNRERYLAVIDGVMDYVACESMMLSDPIKMLLWLMELRDMVDGSEELAREETEFFIKHGDDSVFQYMKDETWRITGVVDWQWSYVTTKSEAFASCHFSPSDWQTDPTLISKEERCLIDAYERFQRPDLADCVRNGKIYQGLDCQLRYQNLSDPDLCDINSVRTFFLGDKAGRFETRDEWAEMAEGKYRQHPRVRAYLNETIRIVHIHVAERPAMAAALMASKEKDGAADGVDK